MNRTVKGLSLLTTTLTIFSFLFFVGCVSTKQKFQDDMMAKGVKPLSDPQLTKLFSGSVQHEKHPTKYEGEFKYGADGSLQGKVWGDWGEKHATGKWVVNDQNQVCSQWLEGEFGSKILKCFSIYPGSGKNEYTRVHESGPPSDVWANGIIPFTISAAN